MTSILPINNIEINGVSSINVDEIKSNQFNINECVLAPDESGRYGAYMCIGQNGFIKIDDERININYAIEYVKTRALLTPEEEIKVNNFLFNLRRGKEDCLNSNIEISAEDVLLDYGYDDVIIFKNFSYDSALIGVSDDNRAIYDYDLMIEWIVRTQGWTEDEAADWINYNTLNAKVEDGPIVMYRVN